MIYELLEEDTAPGLSDLVNKRIAKGYLPLGTPFTAIRPLKYISNLIFLQAVILMEESDENLTPAASGEVHEAGESGTAD